MPIDTLHIDLKALIEQRAGVRLSHCSTTAGGEYKGSCPWCGGKDRFFVQPYHPTRPHYHCRGCGRTGDAIAFLQEHEHLTFKQALVELELEAEGFIEPTFRFYDDPPCKEWQAAAGDFIARAERYLWHPKSLESVKALEYLRERGFTDETIKGARLGYCPLTKEGKWFTDSLERWGLTKEQTGKDVVRIADGIVIPWIAGDEVWKICIKRPWVEDPKKELVYGQVVGSAEGLYNPCTQGILDAQPAVLVEGEFDCLSVAQETDVACIATGSASRGRTPRWVELLSKASLVLQSFDNDPAGDDGAVFWLEQLPNAIRWKPWKKDPNEMLTAGSPVGSWVELGISSTHITQPMPCPSEPEIQASTQQVIDTCCLCDAPVDEVDELGKPYCLLHWNLMYWGKKPCPTVVESKNKTHTPYPVSTMDNAGFFWCERCMQQPKLMNVGVERGFPAFYFEWQHDMVYVEAGRDEYFNFACTAGYAKVWGALEAVKKIQTSRQEVVNSF